MSNRTIRALSFLLGIAVFSSLLVGCFGAAPAKEPGQSPAAPAAAGTATGQQQQAGAKGGTLTIINDDPPTLDPALVQDSTSAEYVVEIFSGLVTLTPKLEVAPDLAESWDVSADGKTYTFHLRKGAKFQNGREVKAQDFKYSIERSADPKTGSVVADTYLGDIVGVKEMLAGKNKQISGLKVVDDNTLQITIDAPKVYFLAKLTYSTAFVVDKDNVEASRNWTNKPNGTGPFKLKEWKKGEILVLARNDNYYNGVAKLDEIRYLLAGGSPMTMYENNEIDINHWVGLTDIERVLDKSSNLNKELLRDAEGNPGVPELSIGYIGFNNKVAPFDDPKVRQAFTQAVDKRKIVEVVLKNVVSAADGILPPGMPGYNPDIKGLPYDPAKAKQLLTESKYAGKLPPIKLSISGTGAAPRGMTPAILEMWKQNLGVDVQVEQVEWATYLDDLKQHKYQMFEVGWVADYPDPQDFLDILFHSQSLDNNPQYSNPQVDKLLEQARTETDVAKRLSIYQQVEQVVVNDAAWMPLTYSRHYVLVKPHVQGYTQPAMTVPKYRFVSLTKK